jgi:thioredoxin reductase
VYHAIIVGGGPAGLSAGLVLGRCLRQVVIFDHGQPRNAAARYMHGYLGHDGIEPSRLHELGRRELADYRVALANDEVVEVRPLAHWEQGFSAFEVVTASGRIEQTRKVLVATGMCDELPDIPGLAECYGKSVHHCQYCDGCEYASKRLAVVGPPPGFGVGLAVSLHNWTEHVTVLSNGLELAGEDRGRLAMFGIAIRRDSIARLDHTQGNLHAVIFADGSRLPVDGLFFDGEKHPRCRLLEKLGCHFEQADDKPAVTSRQRSSVPGLFVAGDADAEVQFAIVAAAEGAKAAVTINREIQDEDEALLAREMAEQPHRQVLPVKLNH